MFFDFQKVGITMALVALAVFGSYIFVTRGDATIALTLTSNPTLEDGLVGHWTFDGKDMREIGFDVSTASFVDSFSIAEQESFPRGMAFSPDGTKMFVVGSAGDDVNEYTLSTGFDVSTASFVDSFSVSSQETNPHGIAFNTDGTKMFVVGNSGDDVNEYTLSAGFDVSTASFVDSFSVSSQETTPHGIAFNADGTKMFVVGIIGDDVNEYTLSTGFDVSTASFVDSFSVSSQETFPTGLAFSPDGRKMFVVGDAGDDVNEYTLSTGFDVSTASFVDSFSIATQESFVQSVAFNSDGTKMFVIGYGNDRVHEYTLDANLSSIDRIGGNTGTLLGTTTAIGRLGQALEFDGIDDYADIGPAHNGVQTIAFWIRIATSTANQNIIDLNGSAYITTNGSSDITATGFASPTIYIDSSSSSAAIPDTGWYHVVITTGTGINASDMDIGRIEGQGNFGGILDDVRIYNRALSLPEITRLYQLGATTRIAKTLTTNPNLESELVGHWSFDGKHMGTSTAIDRGAGDHTGTNNGTLIGPITAIGRLGQALEFDGIDDYVDIGDTARLQTIAFWMKVATSTADQKIIDFGATKYITTDGSSNITTNKVKSPTIYVNGSSASANIADTGWHHVVVTTTSQIDAGDFDIGRIEGQGYFGGTLDDVRIYSRVLGDTDVERLYQLGQ